MFRRKNSGLPTTGSLHGVDGSGKAVHMDAPLWRAWKNADGYIKGTYIFLVLSVMLMIFGYRQLRYRNCKRARLVSRRCFLYSVLTLDT
jgi:hypothetical protein